MINLTTECAGRRSGTWVRRCGDHETAGVGVYVNDTSAHVELLELKITFDVDREDIPAAWDTPIDVIKLRTELVAAVVRRMSEKVLEELLREVHLQRQSAFWDGERATRTKIREALGL
jgi:hypothetical protein